MTEFPLQKICQENNDRRIFFSVIYISQLQGKRGDDDRKMKGEK